MPHPSNTLTSGGQPPARTSDDAQLEADAATLHRGLSELIRVYQFRDRERICCHDISITQCYALEALILEGPLGVNELAAELYLDKSTVSRVIDALERKGYVERRDDPADRRALLLAPTVAGRRLHARIEAEILAQEKQVLAGLDPDVRRSIGKVLSHLARAAARCVAEETTACAP